MTGRLVALVIPMGLDTLGVSLALGMAGIPTERWLRLALLFAGFEAAMPLIGAGIGLPLGRAIGAAADIVAAVVIIALGLYMLFGNDSDERDTGHLLTASRAGLTGAVGLGLGISLDELAIGFSAGLLRIPLLELAVLVSVQAFIATQVGLRVGSRVSEAARERVERLAGLALLGLGLVLLGAQL